VDSLIGVSISGEIMVSLWSLILPEPMDEWPVYDDNYIHPEWRTETLRSFALNWWEQRSLERVRSASDPSSDVRRPSSSGSPSLPIRFHQHVYPAQAAHVADIVGRGYEPWIYFDELRRDLSQPVDSAVVPEGYEIKPIGDVASIDVLAVRNDAFRDHRGSQQWTLEFWESRWSEMHRADASFVVVNGSVPVAFVRCGVYPHDAELRGYTEGWIEQVGTARAHRGRGLAAALIQSAMAAFASSGIEYATLEVDTENPTGAHALYTGLGFERVRGYVDYTKVVDL
jgi:ribosomal protein S18 acetylase RimI-like enzyme